jgi:hypothetical protein
VVSHVLLDNEMLVGPLLTLRPLAPLGERAAALCRHVRGFSQSSTLSWDRTRGSCSSRKQFQ